MKYKLINQVTNEAHICAKVTIDGLDYYVNFGWINNLALKENIYLYNSTFKEIGKVISIYGGEFSVELLDKCISGWAIKELCQKVIATNNPSIDIPKVIDEVERLFPTNKKGIMWMPNRYEINNQYRQEGYNKSQETHPFSEDDMVEFAAYFYFNAKKNNYLIQDQFKEWKSQQPKVLYYEEN